MPKTTTPFYTEISDKWTPDERLAVVEWLGRRIEEAGYRDPYNPAAQVDFGRRLQLLATAHASLLEEKRARILNEDINF